MCFFKKKKVKEAEAKKEENNIQAQQTNSNEAKVEEEPSKKEATRTYHVSKRSDGKWAVKFAGGQKAIKLFDTQKEAVAFTKVMAENQEGAMLVHNSKGVNKGRIKKK